MVHSLINFPALRTVLLVTTFAPFYFFAQNSNIGMDKLPRQNLTTGFPNCVFYEIFVRSFCDSNNDGIGDIPGITSKLDYLQELGIGAIWITPVHPSPSYHKYDVTDYYDVDKEYGTLSDMQELVTEAHARNIRVIMDLVINHTSVLHPWFVEAQKSAKNSFTEYYNWMTSENDYTKAEHWHDVASPNKKQTSGKKYFGFFDKSMPDLNFDNTEVRNEIIKIGKFWIEKTGVDGFRLDAAKWIFMPEDETKTYEWWQYFTAEMNKVQPSIFLTAEVTDHYTGIAPYFKKSMASAFNFDFATQISNTVITKNDTGLVDFVNRCRNLYFENNNGFIDATFITNHDQDRIMSVVKGDKSRAEMAAAILFTLPGSPFVYNGEEIGMQGMKPDENIREPFLWSSDADYAGQTKWIKARYSTPEKVMPLSEQRKDDGSIFTFYKKMILLRNQSPALRVGAVISSPMSKSDLIVYTRELKEDKVIVIHNLNDVMQNLDLYTVSKGTYKILFAAGDCSIQSQTKINIPPMTSVIIHVTPLE